LKSRKLRIRSVADLGDKSVIAFQNAKKYMGADFSKVVAGNRRYKEMAQQEGQAQMLLLGRIDLVIMDESIFRYYRQRLVAERKDNGVPETVAYEIFPPTPYKAAFISPEIRDAFNRGIVAMRRDGRYQAIYKRYADQYFPVRN
jgi:polar amino acid transport system substrate-binding protein